MLFALANSPIVPPLLAALIGVAGVFLGLWLTTAGRRTRLMLPFSAGVLLGVVFFGLLPELVEEMGWRVTAFFFAAGYGSLFLIDRYVAPVCPTCGHDHDHASCHSELHGFAAPLLGASMLHSFFDGWSVATAQMASEHGIRLAVALAVALHKIPEGIALGAIVRASVESRSTALFWSVLAEMTTLVGGIVALAIAPGLGAHWITYPLGIAAGWLFFLGAHALHEEWKRRGPVPAFMTALTGAAGAAALQQGVQAWFR
ncbi:MAG TPA: ZIP family metal transporter [Bryobacteraceae bacterium]|nr:ZIP family metal transporter [Bryobacteraceae bacterium]